MFDMRNPSLRDFQRKFILAASSMNGGKTKRLVDGRDRFQIGGYNVASFVSAMNAERDGMDCFRVNGTQRVPAKSVLRASEIRDNLGMLDELVTRRKPSYRGETVEIDGVTYRVGEPIRIIKIDEINLFTLTEPETREMIKLVDECRYDRNQGVWGAGLTENFRHQPFGHFMSLLLRADDVVYLNAQCKMDVEGQPCDNSASHTRKVWRYDAIDPEVRPFFEDAPRVSWWNKKGEPSDDTHVSAPYWAPTVEIEISDDKIPDDRDKPFAYVPACNRCALDEHPYQEATMAVYDAFIKGKDPRDVVDSTLVERITTGYLLKDGWVTQTDSGIVAVPHYMNSLGSFTPLLPSDE